MIGSHMPVVLLQQLNEPLTCRDFAVDPFGGSSVTKRSGSLTTLMAVQANEAGRSVSVPQSFASMWLAASARLRM